VTALPYRFGLGLPTNGPFANRDGLLRSARRAEALGLDDVWTNDFLDFGRSRITRSTAGTYEAARGQDPNFFEGVATIALLAGALRKIGVGIGSVVLPLRDPRLFAKQVATIHELSGRRLTISPAIGGPQHDFEIMQVPYRMRGRLMDEHLATLHAIFFAEHPVSYDGPYVKFSGAVMYPKPHDLRIWITGETEPAWHRVAKWGTGWLTSYPSVAEYTTKVSRMREIVSAAGRDPDTIVTAATMFLCVESTRTRALEIATRSLTDRFGSVEAGLEKAVVGDPREVQDQLARRHAAGLRYLELKFLAHDLEAYLEMLARTAEDVLPALRRLS
jgi:alkanesulfonate monooxygenase SsuD/methylene tetrahydromethanopterin reductase-like flavin-dependent oxidoreductase (luciferase family)